MDKKIRYELRFLYARYGERMLMERSDVERLLCCFTQFIFTGESSPLYVKIKNIKLGSVTKNPARHILRAALYNFMFVENNFFPLTEDDLAYFLFNTIDYYSSIGLTATKNNMKRHPDFFNRLRRTCEKWYDANDDYSNNDELK